MLRWQLQHTLRQERHLQAPRDTSRKNIGGNATHIAKGAGCGFSFKSPLRRDQYHKAKVVVMLKEAAEAALVTGYWCKQTR